MESSKWPKDVVSKGCAIQRTSIRCGTTCAMRDTRWRRSEDKNPQIGDKPRVWVRLWKPEAIPTTLSEHESAVETVKEFPEYSEQWAGVGNVGRREGRSKPCEK